jgi:hypothetical protein
VIGGTLCLRLEFRRIGDALDYTGIGLRDPPFSLPTTITRADRARIACSPGMVLTGLFVRHPGQYEGLLDGRGIL